MSRTTEDLANHIAEFPGIGPRQARRIVQFLLFAGAPFRAQLALLIESAGAHAVPCKKCFKYDDKQASGLCTLCADTSRDATVVMVVEKDIDIEGIENSGAYRGNYFVLGGLLTMTQRKNARAIRSKELLEYAKKNPVQEIIFALSTTPEGDYTARELMKEVGNTAPEVKTTLLGRGLSVGAEIEYADAETLRSAFKNRT